MKEQLEPDDSSDVGKGCEVVTYNTETNISKCDSCGEEVYVSKGQRPPGANDNESSIMPQNTDVVKNAIQFLDKLFEDNIGTKREDIIEDELDTLRTILSNPKDTEGKELEEEMTFDDYRNFYITVKCMFETGDMDRLYEAVQDLFSDTPPMSDEFPGKKKVESGEQFFVRNIYENVEKDTPPMSDESPYERTNSPVEGEETCDACIGDPSDNNPDGRRCDGCQDKMHFKKKSEPEG